MSEGVTVRSVPPRRTPGGPISMLFAGAPSPDSRVAEARAAGQSGDWPRARAILEALASEPDPPGEALAGLAVTQRVTGDYVEACRSLERAYLAFLDAADLIQAVRAAVALVGQCQGLGEKAASLGWERRAQRLLEEIGECPERGYLAVARTACEYYDPREIEQRAGVALEMARRFGDRELELRALGDRGLALVCQGQVDQGFALLDEMMVAVAAGEMRDPETQSKSICAVLSACERTGDSVRADYWCGRIEADPRLRPVGIIDAHCQIVHGTVEAMCGRWDEAETRLTRAIAVRTSTAYHAANSRARLAALRIQQGRYADAAELLLGTEDSMEAAAVQARLHLAMGRPDKAAVLLRAAARALASDTMRVVPVLALLVDAQLRCGDRDAAERTARRLSALEDSCSSNEIRAITRLALSRIAAHGGDHAGAIDELETSLALLSHLDRPLLSAQVRLELARSLAATRSFGTARAETEAALAVFQRLGVVHDRAAAERLLDEVSARSTATPDAVARPADGIETLTPREAEVAGLVASGLSNREIARRLHLSVRTVETHVDRVLGKLGHHSRTRLAAHYRRE